MIEIQLVPASVLTDSVVWINLANNAVAGTGSYITGLYPGEYQADLMTIKGCPATGVAEVGTEIMTYNLVTRNNDQKNDAFVVDCISRFPDNNVKIFNRSGVLVYEADGYNNNTVVFRGLGERGVYTAGNDLPAGTYFYVIDKRDGSRPKTGYLELVK
jgi:gliding motility-associated-like protein